MCYFITNKLYLILLFVTKSTLYKVSYNKTIIMQSNILHEKIN